MTSIDYFISLNSPWTYMGSHDLIAFAKEHGVVINTLPVKIGVVFENAGGLPLPQRPEQRKAYRMMELKRWKKRRNLPLTLEPAHFPSDEWPGVQLVYAATIAQGAPTDNDAARLSSEIGRAIWEREENAADPDVLTAACERAGLDPAALRETAATSDIAGKYESATQAAIAAGVFGAPTYKIGDELFWGQDRLDFVFERLSQ